MPSVFIDGSAGTTGLRIAQRLAARKELTVVELKGSARKDLAARVKAANCADLVFLCLPDAAAKEIVPHIAPGVKVCDTSTAHRTAPGWVYGFPELAGQRQALKTANRVAVPGCHASGFIALAAPLVKMGVLAKTAALTSFSLTGYSGGGKAMIADYEAHDRPTGHTAPRAYGLGLNHKHLPEMAAVSGLSAPPLFSPIVADYYSGMAVSLPLFEGQLCPGATAQTVAEALATYYKGEQGIRVHPLAAQPENGFLPANGLSGSDGMQLYIFTNGTGQIWLTALFDNLGKGSSGAAVQCMNLMLGLPEYQGLVL